MPMPTVMLRPVQILSSNNMAEGGNPGGAPGHQLISDDNENTFYWAQLPGPDPSRYNLRFAFGSPGALPPGFQVRQIHLVWRFSTTAAHTVTVALMPGPGATNALHTEWRVLFNEASSVWNHGVDRFFSGSSGQLTQTDVDNLVMEISGNYQGFVSRQEIREAWLYLTYNRPPTATVALGGMVSIDQPTVSWTYSDPDGDPQERYLVRVFESQQYSAPGFDASKDVPVWDSGVVHSSATSVQIGRALDNGSTYRAYVWVGDVGSGDRLSVTGPYAQYQISTTPPATPTLTGEVTGEGDVAVTFDNPTQAGRPSADYTYIERSVDNGASWQKISGDITSRASTFVDRRAPWNTPVQYRARSVSTSTVPPTTSLPSNVVTLAVDEKVYGWRLYDPALNTSLRLFVIGDSWQLKSLTDTAIFQPLGSRTPVVVTGMVRGEQFNLECFFATKAESDAFEKIRTTVGPKYLRNSEGNYWVAFTGGRTITLPGHAAHRVFSVELTEVAAP